MLMRYMILFVLLVALGVKAQTTNFVWSSSTTSNHVRTNISSTLTTATNLHNVQLSNTTWAVSNAVWSITNSHGFSTNVPVLTLSSNILYLKITNGAVVVVTNTL